LIDAIFALQNSNKRFETLCLHTTPLSLTLSVDEQFWRFLGVEIDAALDLVSRRGWLTQPPRAFRNALLARVHLQRFTEGEIVYEAGDPPGGVYGVVSGAVRISVVPWEHSPIYAHYFRPGSWFGEAAALSGQPRMASHSASGETELLHLPIKGVNDLVRADPTCLRFFSILTYGHLHTALGATADLMIRDHVKRFIAVLLRLGGCREATQSGERYIEVCISQDDLALMANVARTTANSILRRLHRNGLVKVSYRRIDITAPDRLRAMLTER
jgi:CRP-like cAMP-binding protein